MASPVPAAPRGAPLEAERLVPLDVVAVLIDRSSAAVAFARDPAGRRVAVAVRPSVAADLRDDLAGGLRPRLDASPVSVLRGFPWPTGIEE